MDCHPQWAREALHPLTNVVDEPVARSRIRRITLEDVGVVSPVDEQVRAKEKPGEDRSEHRCVSRSAEARATHCIGFPAKSLPARGHGWPGSRKLMPAGYMDSGVPGGKHWGLSAKIGKASMPSSRCSVPNPTSA